jgi:glycosyltransferase involved in cell wall biosynthesis
MNVLFCNKFFYPKGGAEVSMFETARVLEKNGHGTAFFSMHHRLNKTSPFSRYFVSNVDYEGGSYFERIKAAGRIFYSLEARRRVGELLEDNKIDLVHLNNIYHQLSPSILYEFKKRRLPMVMSLRDYKLVCPSYNMLARGEICESCRGGRFYNAILKRCHRGSLVSSTLLSLETTFHQQILRVYDGVDIFMATSRFQKEKMQEMGFKGTIEVLPNLVNLEDHPEPRYGWGEPVAVYFGRLSPEKGLITLLDAVRGLELKLHIIGEGPQKKSLEEKLRREGITNVLFFNHQPGTELVKMISRAMFVVLPSEWYETFGRTALEAFALGKPVIGASIGGIPELVTDGVTGLTFEPGDARDLRDKLRRLLGDEKRIIEMGRKARRLVEEKYSPAPHYEALMGIYQRATGISKRPGRKRPAL